MKIKITCNHCKTEIEKDHWLIKPNRQSYCSRKCSNAKSNSKWNNYISKNDSCVCVECGRKRDYRNKTELCQLCLIQRQKSKVLDSTIGELRKKHKQKFGKWYSAEIRNHCRNHNVDLTFTPCQKCGYDKHVELCHIKPINSFEDSATIREINCSDNLVVLCPNHHWEFDNNCLTLGEIGSRGGT